MKLFGKISIVICVAILVAVVAIFYLPYSTTTTDITGDANSPTPSVPIPTNTSTPLASPSSSLIVGNPNAQVTLVEYGDFQCPICGRFFKEIEPQLRSEYFDKGLAKIEFHIFPYIGPESIRAGEAALCANDQGMFMPYHDGLFYIQNGENMGTFNDQALKDLAARLELKTEQFNSCFDSGQYKAAVESGLMEARDRGVTATPTIFIGSHKIVGAQPFAIYKTFIDEQLKGPF